MPEVRTGISTQSWNQDVPGIRIGIRRQIQSQNTLVTLARVRIYKNQDQDSKPDIQ